MDKHSALFEYVLPSPLGQLGLATSEQGIQVLAYTSGKQKIKIPTSGLAAEVYHQLTEYFDARRIRFNLPLDASGTPFQKTVWRELSKIPFGESVTYGEIANKLQSGPRAVGNACRKNPISIIVPCHRVVSKSGVGGYSGAVLGKPIERKTWLLRHECAS